MPVYINLPVVPNPYTDTRNGPRISDSPMCPTILAVVVAPHRGHLAVARGLAITFDALGRVAHPVQQHGARCLGVRVLHSKRCSHIDREAPMLHTGKLTRIRPDRYVHDRVEELGKDCQVAQRLDLSVVLAGELVGAGGLWTRPPKWKWFVCRPREDFLDLVRVRLCDAKSYMAKGRDGATKGLKEFWVTWEAEVRSDYGKATFAGLEEPNHALRIAIWITKLEATSTEQEQRLRQN